MGMGGADSLLFLSQTSSGLLPAICQYCEPER